MITNLNHLTVNQSPPEGERMEKSIPRKWNQEASKIDFKPKLIGKDKGQFILINGTVNQEDTTILNTYAEPWDSYLHPKNILLGLKTQTNSSSARHQN